MKLQGYLVTWRDSATNSGWRELKDRKHVVSVIHSIGWLVRQDKGSVTLTTSVSSEGTVCDALTIPREAVVEMTKVLEL